MADLSYLKFAGVVVLSLIGLLLLLILVLRTYNTFRRKLGDSGGISRWAHTVPLSQGQLTAMRSIWQWYKTGRQPPTEPLSALSTTEMADLMAKCELSYFPKRFHAVDEVDRRKRLVKELMAMGMNELESQIVAGMKFGKLGPANDH